MSADPDRGRPLDPAAHDLLGRIAGRWAVLAIESLRDGPLRFSELGARIGGVSQRMLTRTLRELERDGLVARQAFAEVPPRVEYTLTPLGESLASASGPLVDWAREHGAEAARNRESA